MNENLKYTGKILGSATFSFIKINIIGQLLVAFISILILSTIVYQSSSSGMEHVNGIAIVVALFLIRPISFSLLLLCLFVLPFILFSFGNKYILSKTINKLLSDKGKTILFPIIEKVLSKIKSNQPDLLKKGTDKTKLKLKLIQEIKDSKDNNKWLKKIIIYGFKKVNLDDVDFSDENLSFTDIIKDKTISGLQNITAPSRNFFWIILGIQITILILTITRVI